MDIEQEFLFVMCLEGFLYGLYSGLFAMYLQCYGTGTGRRATIIFYAICLLYVLSTLDFVSDLATLILQVGLSIFSLVQIIASGCCDFLAQCILIYRCWIVWSRNIRVVIIPLLSAVLYLATWVVPENANIPGFQLNATSFAATMAVNVLVTGLILYRILKVFLDLKAATTSAERTLGSAARSTNSATNKYRNTIFVIIESGMMLFAIQLVRLVIYVVPSVPDVVLSFIYVINQILNGITPTIIVVRVALNLSFYDEGSFKEAVGSLYFNTPPSDPNSLRRVGSRTSSPVEF